jgi:GNAT superfamily N-acetyltransferase
MDVLRAEAHHLDLIAPLFDAYRQFYRQAARLDAARQFIADRLAANESVIFLALDGQTSLGFTQLYPTFSSISLQRLWILNDLFVAPVARGHGVGEALLQRAETFAKETRSRGLLLSTEITNVTAQRLYERCGWQRNERFFQYYLYVN